MSLTEIAHRRLAAQHLISPTLTNPAELVRLLGAVQSQDYAGAKWALGMRLREVTDAAIERAFADGAILRTHVLRPTWHFVTPADIRWMLALTAPRIKAAMASYDRKLELDDRVFRRSNDAIAQVLRDGDRLTRAELAEALRKAGISVTGSQRLGQIMLRAELDGIVCSGPRRGKQFTYALLEERVPAAQVKDRDEALLELTRRYFATRGPATAHDFSWWSGLSVGDAKRGIEMAGTALEREVIDDRTHWSDPAMPAAPIRSRRVHLLPNYDEYFIGFKDRSAIAKRLESLHLVTGGNALIAHVVTIDGQVVGGWRRTVTEAATVVELDLLAQLSEAERKAVAGVARTFGRFLGVPVELRGLETPRGIAPSPSRSRRR